MPNLTDRTQRLRWLGFALAVCLLALYASVLLTSQRYADGDEAVIGIMARHILTQGARPLFFYGQEYNAGAGLEAYLAAAAFALFGMSGLVLRGVAVLLFVLGLGAVWVLCQRHFSAEVALTAVAIMGVATPLIEWRSKMRGGYAALPLLTALAFLCYFELLDKPTPRRYAALGFVLGVSFLNSALSVSLMLALGLTTLLTARQLLRWPVLLSAATFALGIGPLIRYDLANEFGHLNYLLGLRGGDSLTAETLGTVVTNYLPRFFVASNVDGYIATVPWDAWVEMGLLAILLLFVPLWLRGGQNGKGGEVRPKLTFLIFSIPVHILFFALSRERILSARYFLPLYPALAILAALSINSLWQRRGVTRSLATVSLAALLTLGTVNNLRHIGPSIVNDDILDTNWQIANVPTRGDLTARLSALLQENDIKHVRSGYFIQWRLLFESNETIVASSETQFPTIRRYVDYDNEVNTADRVAVILHSDSQHYLEFLNSGAAEQMQRVDLDAYAVFLPR